jgi:hypothetical protein
MHGFRPKTRRIRKSRARLIPASGRSATYGRRRGKSQWAGRSLGDAFSENRDYQVRRAAQSRFYAACAKTQRAMVGLVEPSQASTAALKVKAQIGPCYSDYPAKPAALAAIGLTGYLEHRVWRGRTTLLRHRLAKTYLDDPASKDGVKSCPGLYAQLACDIVEAVEVRLNLVELSRYPECVAVEVYRLFAADCRDLSFRTVRDIARAVILYEDVLPAIEGANVHPLTLAIAADARSASAPYAKALEGDATTMNWLKTGRDWARAICQALAKYLPENDPDEDLDHGRRWRNRSLERDSQGEIRLRPLASPSPPEFRMLGPEDMEISDSRLRQRMVRRRQRAEQAKEAGGTQDAAISILERLQSAIAAATSQARDWEDTRIDILVRALAVTDFKEGPLSGAKGTGYIIDVAMPGGEATQGELHDTFLEPSADPAAVERLLADSAPIVQALKQAVYPDRCQVPQDERLRTSGDLDGSRLPLAGFSEAIYKRHRIVEQKDRNGGAVLLIACDGSGSLSSRQMAMVKLVTAGLLRTQAATRVNLMAGLYHSGEVGSGQSRPLIRWMYHPTKTPGLTPEDALRGLASLSGSGTGAQSDAVQFTFMYQEARKHARGRNIYWMVISDTSWNQCFETSESAADEVRTVFETAYSELGDKLDITLVGLGVDEETGFEDLLDTVICISDEDLEDIDKVAAQIGRFVAQNMVRQRRESAERPR